MSSTSKKNVRDEVTKKLEVALDKLYRIWNEIGIDETQVCNRAGTVSMHLCNLINDMVSEEEQLREQIAVNIQQFVDEMSSLCLELALPVVKVNEQLSMVQREKELRTKLDSLNREKQDRLKRLKVLKEQDQRLCDSLCFTPYYVPSSSVPSRDQLHELEAHIKMMEAEKDKRFKEFVSTKQKVVSLCEEMDYDPETSFERELICEDDDAFQLSTENMDSLKTVLHNLEKKNESLRHQVKELWDRIHNLWNRLDLSEEEREEFETQHKGHKQNILVSLRDEILRCEQLKYANLQQFVEGARKELVEQWNCCYFSKEQRDAFPHYSDENYTEELLELHEKELNKMREYHRLHQPVLDLLAKRDQLWSEMLEFEKKASDPNRFFNDRGGKLLMEEKARKKLIKELPRVEEEAKEQIENWEKETGHKFLVEGVPFPQFTERQWTVFREQKELEKQERLRNKAKQMEEEMIFGSKPTTTTPAKRRLVNTPSSNRTPLKSRKLGESSSSGTSSASVYVSLKLKMNETPRTPASVSRIQHSSIFHSPFSRPPLSTAKTPNMNHTTRRRSLRQARKVLQESMQNANNSRSGKKKPPSKGTSELFSQTTVSSGCSVGNASLATMGSYQEFAKGLSHTARPNCRSSVVPAVNTSPVRRW